MQEQVYADVRSQAIHFRNTQIGRYTHAYHATFFVPLIAQTRMDVFLVNDEDSDFHIDHIMGNVQSPVVLSGGFVDDGDVDFPRAGTNGGSVSSLADRGLVFKITEVHGGRDLTKGIYIPALSTGFDWTYLSFAAVFPPGYSSDFLTAIPFEYNLEKSKRLRISVLEQGSTSSEHPELQYSRVSFGFLGKRYES